MKKTLISAPIPLVLVVAISTANAQDLDDTQDLEVVTEETSSSTIEFSGFVDTSIVIPITGYAPEDDQVTFGLDQVEVNIIATPTDGLLLRTDLHFFPAAGAPTTADDLIEQGYIDYTFGGGESGAFILAGKRNAPIGAEGIDPTDLYQYSHGQLFTSATPSNLTGIFGGYRSDAFTAMVWVTNDWDMPGTARSATPGMRLQVGLSSGHIGLSSTYGPVVDDDPYFMVDVDAFFELGDLTLLAEANFGTSDALTSVGGLLTGSYAISEVVAATLRVDYLNQETEDGMGDVDNVSATLAGLFGITDNFGAVAELRADIPNGGDLALTGAFELLATW